MAVSGAFTPAPRGEIEARSAAVATEESGEAEAIEAAATWAASDVSVRPSISVEAAVRAEMVSAVVAVVVTPLVVVPVAAARFFS